MCSIGEDDFGDEGGVHSMKAELPLTLDEISNEICKKCNQDQVVVKLNCKEAQCKNCFLLYTHHKFRASLGSTKVLPRNANVLILFNGNKESVVLLDMVRYALKQEKYRRLHFNPFVLYIDENCLCDGENSNIDRNTIVESIYNLLSDFEIISYYLSIASSKEPVIFDQQLDASKFQDMEKEFKKNFSNIKSLTSRQDFLVHQRKNQIRRVATFLHCNYVFLPEICSDLATILLTNVALGRGGSVALDVAFCDDRVPDIKLIRPIRDLNFNEVKNYIKLNKLHYIETANIDKNDDAYASIQNLTEKFVNGLQENFPSTVSTIFRTGDKIAPNDKISSTSTDLTKEFDKKLELNIRCRLCKATLDVEDSKTLLAIEFSRLVSANAKKVETINNETAVKIEKILESKENLCHACRNIFKDGKEVNEFIFEFC